MEPPHLLLLWSLALGAVGCPGPETPGATTAEPGSSTTGQLPPDPTTGAPPTGTSTSTSPGTGDPSTSTGETPTSTGVEPFCGDGVLDPGEACDEGLANSDEGACTKQCAEATCGDSLVWKGVEECDFGPASSEDYGGCTAACEWAARCGDAVVDAGHEECDLGILNGKGPLRDDLPGCSLGCRWVARIVFVSSATYTGDLGGLSGADLKCRNLAAAAGLDNAITFRAWLSDAFEWPAVRFQQAELVGAPYALLSGEIVAESFTDLVDFGPLTGISVTEKGEAVFDGLVWTNTSAFGERFSPVDHCDNWTAGAFDLSARVGWNALAIEAGPAWDSWQLERHYTSYTSFGCNYLYRLYCFEDGYESEE